MSIIRISNLKHIGRFLNSHRLFFIIALGLILGVSNLLELIDIPESLTFFRFLVDVITGILVPLVLMVLLLWLERSEKERQATERQLALQKTLTYQISKTHTWNELIEVVIQFPRTIIPYIGAFLWLYDKESNQYLVEAGWGFTGMKPPNPPPCPFDPSCPNICALDKKISGSTKACNCVNISGKSMEDGLQVLCISFVYSGQPIGILYAYMQNEYEITKQQESLLANISPVISQTLFETKVKDAALLQSNAIKEERNRIAKNLHDTVAQDLFYLRLQLDQFANSNYRDLVKLVTVQEELGKLRDVADGAYAEIRQTLNALENEHNKDLTSALSHYADIVAKRTGLEVTFVRKGTPRSLPFLLSNQIFNIFREILNNIEIHARALHVNIELAWSPDCFILSVLDDGQGFDTQMAQIDGHYGQKILHERATLINANLRIVSSLGKGTHIELVTPLRNADEPARTESFHWVKSIGE